MLSGAIDVHCHFLPPNYIQFLADAGYKTIDGGIPVPKWDPVTAMETMARRGIAQSILSISSPFLARSANAAGFAREINDYAADLAARQPGRFNSFAILPMQNPKAALAEARYVLEELKLAGVTLPTNVDGRYLGDPEFGPLFEYLADREAVCFIHPTSPCCMDAIGLGVPAPMIEFPFDTVRTIASLVFSPVFPKLKGIRFIVPHLGGSLTTLIDRIAAVGQSPYMLDRKVPREETLAFFERLWFDTAGLNHARQFDVLRLFAPISQIMFGTDYPFTADPRIDASIEIFKGLNMTPEERHAVEYGNAKRLLGHACCDHT